MKLRSLIIHTFILILLGISVLNPCTMFKITIAGKTLIGNNEDWKDPYTKIIYFPPEKGKFGGIYFSYGDGEPQGGMNDQGLVFDGFSTSSLPVLNSVGREVFQGNLVSKAMEECSTVEEVIRIFNKYDLRWMKYSQLMFADKDGDSVIIEGDVMHRGKGNFQIATNFYLSKIEKTEKINDPRYLIASDLLEHADVSLKFCRTVLNSVHQESSSVNTMYSNIYDPQSKLIYLYLFHNFENAILLDMNKELKKGKRMEDLPDRFPGTHAFKKYRSIYDKDRLDKLPPVIKVDPVIFNSYTGTYQYSPGYNFYVKNENHRLFFYINDINKHEMFPYSNTEFFTKSIDAKFTFNKDDSGKVISMTLHYGGKRTCKKID